MHQGVPQRRGVRPYAATGGCGKRVERTHGATESRPSSEGRRVSHRARAAAFRVGGAASWQWARAFFDDHLKRLFPQLVPGLTLARSRPDRKNDNRFVEQKNDALVRRYVGYARFDTPEQVAALYAAMSVEYNLFQPVLQLVEYNTPRKDGPRAKVDALVLE